jgi:hypothetical protein
VACWVSLTSHARVLLCIAHDDAPNPVLLLIQQGPGLPMINEARRFEHLPGWSRSSRSPTGISAAAAARLQMVIGSVTTVRPR